MATLSKADLLKRDNIDAFVSRINSGGAFRISTDTAPLLKATGSCVLKLGGQIFKYTKSKPINSDMVRMFCKGSGSDTLQIELKGKSPALYTVNKIFKDKDFGGVAGKSTGAGAERQELGLIDALNAAAVLGDSSYVASLGKSLKLKSASKNTGLSPAGQEPYIDVFIEDQKGKVHGISCKGESAPSIAGGGLVGLNLVVPNLMKKLYSTLEYYLKKELGLEEGSVIDANAVPDIFIKIPDQFVKEILVGNTKMGGPVDFMYIGKMDVKSSISKAHELTLNGKFYSISEYMKKIPNFYFRIRKRDISPTNNMMITFSKKNKEGFPLLFLNPDNNKSNFRLVITAATTSKAKTLTLK